MSKQAALALRITGVPTDGLETSKPCTMNLSFAGGTKNVFVEFEYSNENIFVTPARGGKAGKRFEVKFETEGPLDLQYVIEIKTVDKESFEPFDIVCYDENSVECFREHHRIRLIIEPEKFQLIRQILVWLKRHPILIAPATLALLVALVGQEKIWRFIRPAPPVEPSHFVYSPAPPQGEQPPDEFLLGFANWPNKAPDGWFLAHDWQLMDDPIAEHALLIKGEGIGGFKAPNDQQSIYDVKLFLQIQVLKNQKSARWLLRVQNPKDYYAFRLTFPTDESGADLAGEIFKNNARIGTLTATELPVARAFYKLDPGDVLGITIDVKGREFKHKIDIECIRNDSQNAKGRPRHWIFRDNKDDYYKWGALGFESLGPDDITRLQYITIKSAE